jgi:exonuclease III
VHKTRDKNPGGGVAILIHKSLQFSKLAIPNLKTMEAVAVTISIKIKKKNELIDIISIYILNGNNCLEEELNQIAHHPNSIILGGDFNGHHIESGNPIATNRTKAVERWLT